MSDVLPPREEVIAVVPLEDPGVLVEAPVAPHIDHPLVRRRTGVPFNHHHWDEQNRNQVLHDVCVRIDQTRDLVEKNDKHLTQAIIVTAGIFIFFIVVLGLILITHKNTIDSTETRLKAAEKKVKILLATSVEKQPSDYITFGNAGAVLFGFATSNGNVTAEKPNE